MQTAIERLDVSAYTIPADYPEADGTYQWNSTTLVLVEACAGGAKGTGYTYADVSTAHLARSGLAPGVIGRNAMEVPAIWNTLVNNVRNLGRPGIAAMAISAVDNALWDLKARLLDLPLVSLLGQVRDGIQLYGSGGFTTYSDEQLQKQLAGWVSEGITQVKMKIGSHPEDDLRRVKLAREAIGPDAELFVDANGALSRTQALHFAEQFAELGVTWFEEPVYHQDFEGLRFLRDRAPSVMDIAAGEYAYNSWHFRRMLEAGAVDVMQADATRCEGTSGFLKAAALCEAYFTPMALGHRQPMSAHCAPSVHAHPCCALTPVRNLEYFHDHVRIEHMLFEGVLDPVGGKLCPDLSRPGNGLEFKHADAEKWRIK